MKFEIEMPENFPEEDILFIDEKDGQVYLWADDPDEGLTKYICLTTEGQMIVDSLTSDQIRRFVPFRGKITLSND